MIAACPECGARYRIDPAKLPAAGARLRCSRCQAVFRVAPEAAAAEARPVATSAPQASPPAGRREPGRGAAEIEVLVAHPESAFAKGICDALGGWGLRAGYAQDGVEAILQIQRALPRIVVLDAALPKMFGFEVCELMKRNEQLRSIPVVLVGAIHDRERYRRPPQDLYGADAYVESHELPDALAPLFARFGLGAQGGAEPAPSAAPPAASVPAASAPVASAATAPVAAPAAAAPVAAPAATAPVAASSAPTPAASDPEAEKAARLARIIVSDVILYNAEQFEAGLRAGNVVEALSAELEEGVGLFEQRVGAGRFDARQMLHEELRRQAAARQAR